MKEIKIVIPEIPPSNNKYMGNSHNFNEYRREKQKWEWLVRASVRKKPNKAIQKAIVKIIYYFPDKRRRDPDNYSGKFILDGLVKSKILKDDSFDNIDLILKGKHDKKNPRTEVIIKEVS